MSSYLILGAGKFGRLALRRLGAVDREARFVVIDRLPEALAAARTPEFPEAQMLEGEAVPFLSAHLGPGSPWDWLIPMVPVHVAYAWLASGPLALNMARNVDPRIQAALLTGRHTNDHATRVKAYQQINQYLGQDVPYLWLARDQWAVIANPKVQNFANPHTPQGSKAVAFDEGVLWPTQIWVS